METASWLRVFASAWPKEDSLLEALGQEIDSEDCSLLNDGPSCQASAFLQTGASLRWSESSLRADQVEQDDPSGAALSFLQQEMSAEAAVGEVHRSSSAEEVAEVRGQKVGEVHVDRSQELLRQWQEERMEMYSSQSAPSVSAIASEATEALQSLRAHPSRGLAGFSLLWVLLLVLIVVTTGALLLLWGPRKLSLEEHQGPQWLPEPLSQDLVSCEAQTRKLVEEGLPQPSSVPQPEPQEQLKQQKLQERLRQLLREAVVCAEANLEELLPSAAGYDCALSKPVSSGRPVKLLCRIEGPLPGGPPPLGLLRAPLSQRSCVCFTAVAEGPAPKKAEECVDFQVSLVGAPWVRIDVQGHELKLLDTESASTPDQAFGDLPRHWKSFVSPERDSKALFGLPSQPPASVLEGRFRFREDVLQVGSEVPTFQRVPKEPRHPIRPIMVIERYWEPLAYYTLKILVSMTGGPLRRADPGLQRPHLPAALAADGMHRGFRLLADLLGAGWLRRSREATCPCHH